MPTAPLIGQVVKTRRDKADLIHKDLRRGRQEDRNLAEAQVTAANLQVQLKEMTAKAELANPSQVANVAIIKQLNADLKLQAKKIARLEEEIATSNQTVESLKQRTVTQTVDVRITALEATIQEKNNSLKVANQSLVTIEASLKGLEEEVEVLRIKDAAAEEKKRSGDEKDAKIEQLQNELNLARRASPKLPPSPAPSPRQESKVVTNGVVPAKALEELNGLKKKLELAKETSKLEGARADFAEEKLLEMERKKRKELTNMEAREKRVSEFLDTAAGNTKASQLQIEEALAENRALERAMETMKMEFEQEKKLLLVTRSAPRSDSGHNSVVNGGGDIVRLKTTIAKMASTMAGLHVTISELRDENTTLLLESLGI